MLWNHDISSSSEDGNRSSFRSVVYSCFLECWTMDMAQNPSNSELTISGLLRNNYALKANLSSGWYITAYIFFLHILSSIWRVYFWLIHYYLYFCTYFIFYQKCMTTCFTYSFSLCIVADLYLYIILCSFLIVFLTDVYATTCFTHYFILLYLVTEICTYFMHLLSFCCLFYAFVLILSSAWCEWLLVLCIYSYFIP
jgi:hypothetical protein